MTVPVATAIEPPLPIVRSAPKMAGQASAAKVIAGRMQQIAAQAWSQSAPAEPAAASDVPSLFAELVKEMSGPSAPEPPLAAGKVDAPPVLPKANTRLSPPASEQAPSEQALATPPATKPAAVPAEPAHTRPLPPVEIKAPRAASEQLPPVTVAVVATPPAPPLKLKLPVSSATGERHQENAGGAVKVDNQPADQPVQRLDTALHVNIRVPGHDEAPPAAPAPQPPHEGPATKVSRPAAPESNEKDASAEAIPPAVAASPIASPVGHTSGSVVSDAVASRPPAEVSHVAAAPAPPQTATPEVNAGRPDSPPHPISDPRPAPAHASPPEPLFEQPGSQQPLRSVSLEFTPDGARDVRLRLTERSGEVHVSLHSTDPAFTGRLHEGVHDLIGSLANAGYDAEAWAPDQGQQNRQRQSSDSGKEGRKKPGGLEDTDFGGLLTQPIQEVS